MVREQEPGLTLVAVIIVISQRSVIYHVGDNPLSIVEALANNLEVSIEYAAKIGEVLPYGIIYDLPALAFVRESDGLRIVAGRVHNSTTHLPAGLQQSRSTRPYRG